MLARHQHESVKLAITRRSYYRYLISDLLQFTLPPPTVSPAHPVTPPTDSPSLSLYVIELSRGTSVFDMGNVVMVLLLSEQCWHSGRHPARLQSS